MHSTSTTAAKDRILEAILPLVTFDGWNKKTLEKAAGDAGISPALVREYFPGGALDVAVYHSAKADAALTEALKNHPEFSTMKIRNRIFTAVMTRLDAHLKDREAIARAAEAFRLPWHSAQGLKALYATVDTIWCAAGDTATDYNFYTKRIILGNVYALTLRVWLHDDSENQQATREFLHRRIENVMQFEKAKFTCREKVNGLKSWLPKRA